MKKMFDYLLTAGTGKEEYEKIENEIRRINLDNLHYYSGAMLFFFGSLGVASMITTGWIHENIYIYTCVTISMLIIAVASYFVQKKDTKNIIVTEILTYSFMSTMYLAAIFLSVKHNSMPAVTYIGVLIIMPLLFGDKPINVAIYQILFVALFNIVIKQYKTPEIASVDLWNSLSFLVISLMTIFISMPIRMKAMVQQNQIEYLSEHDILTGVKNRNAYELYIENCKYTKAESAICIYADVNGLHEMNNLNGHSAGDEMLRAVAQSIKEAFGEEHTYRLGGDEFAAFTEGLNENDLMAVIRNIRLSNEKKGYYISFGYSGPWDAHDCLCGLVSHAETRMYEAKDEFYKNHTEFSRRR